jgi:hypothetical protein
MQMSSKSSENRSPEMERENERSHVISQVQGGKEEASTVAMQAIAAKRDGRSAEVRRSAMPSTGFAGLTEFPARKYSQRSAAVSGWSCWWGAGGGKREGERIFGARNSRPTATAPGASHFPLPRASCCPRPPTTRPE